ncbi:MAG: DUF881 domain-containing protein [Micrococcales bacterium]|nr:DUF881 domain-containing protein [Micrococcales bacterium]
MSQLPVTGATAWRRLGGAFRPRVSRAQISAGLLCLLLGFGVATQVRSTHEADFSSLRQNELIEVLDQLTSRAGRLRVDNLALERQLDQLTDSRTKDEASRRAAEDQATTQGILAGTLPAQGPGVEVVVFDRDGQIDPAMMTALVDELRNAGAEVISVNQVRVTASTWFAPAGGGGLVADGEALTSPFTWLAIGDPDTLQGALGIPGGALAALRTGGADTVVTAQDSIQIEAVRVVAPTKYATTLK